MKPHLIWSAVVFVAALAWLLGLVESHHSAAIADTELRRRATAACSTRASAKYCACIFNHHAEHFTFAEMRASGVPQSEMIAAFSACTEHR